MKDIRTWLVIGLAAIIVFMLFLKGNKKELGNIQSKYDSVLKPHITRIKALQKHEKGLIYKIRNDSAMAVHTKQSYEKTISKLKKDLEIAKYHGRPALVPDDSVQIAMDCLEKESIRDSIDAANYAHIAQLEQEKASLVKDYENIIDDNQAEKNELQAMINLKNQEIGELTKQAKKANRKSKLRLLEGVGLGVIGGLAIGGLH